MQNLIEYAMVYLIIDAVFTIGLYCLVIDIGTALATSKKKPEVIRLAEDAYFTSGYSTAKNKKIVTNQLLMNYVLQQEYRTRGTYKVIDLQSNMKLKIRQHLLFRTNVISMSHSFFSCEITSMDSIPELQRLMMQTQQPEVLKLVKDLNGNGFMYLIKREFKIRDITWFMLLVNTVLWLAVILLPANV